MTPGGLPRWSTVNAIEVSPHDRATVYVTAYRYRLGDFTPFVFRHDAGGKQEGALPRVPVTDLTVHRGDLVVAAQGRSFWILDELGPVRRAAGVDGGLAAVSTRRITAARG